eukprot:2251187-Pyramimonas_sp.AAC.2
MFRSVIERVSIASRAIRSGTEVCSPSSVACSSMNTEVNVKVNVVVVASFLLVLVLYSHSDPWEAIQMGAVIKNNDRWNLWSEEEASLTILANNYTHVPLPWRNEWRAIPNSFGTKAGCNSVCARFGVCNEDLGRCDCPPERTGPGCEEVAMPACELVPGLVHPCFSDHKFAPPCECAIQCDLAGWAIKVNTCLRKLEEAVENTDRRCGCLKP